MIRNEASMETPAMRVLLRLLARRPNLNCPAYRNDESKNHSSFLSVLELLLNGYFSGCQKIFVLFRGGLHLPTLDQDVSSDTLRYRTLRNHSHLQLNVWPYAWRHWHCSRAATALIGVRRYAAQRWMRAVPRDVMRLVVQAVIDTRYEDEWEVE